MMKAHRKYAINGIVISHNSFKQHGVYLQIQNLISEAPKALIKGKLKQKPWITKQIPGKVFKQIVIN